MALFCRYFFTFLACVLVAQHGTAQSGFGRWVGKKIDYYFNDTTAAADKSLKTYPTFGYSPETGLELGASTLWLFYAKKDTNNRLSELQAFTFFTLKAQYGLWLDNALYSDKDTWFFLGKTRVQRFPLLYYGIGPATTDRNAATVDAYSILFRQRVLHKIIPNLFVGPEVDFQKLFGVNFNQPEHHSFSMPLGSEGATTLGTGGALVYDNRHNVLNVRSGFFAELGVLYYNPSLLSDYRFRSINTDIRSFHRLSKKNVLAWQVLGNFLSGDVPFNQLALLGGETMMRGYYLGRYRDKNLLAAQAELRMLPLPFSKRVGATLFAGVGAVSPGIAAFRSDQALFSGGAGLRYLLFPKKDIFIRMDVGFTREGPGFYFFTGEAF
jgi:hypothetical protein